MTIANLRFSTGKLPWVGILSVCRNFAGDHAYVFEATASPDAWGMSVAEARQFGHSGALDHVLDDDGQLIRWASQICAEANGAYQETTVSGAGLRIMGTTSGAETHRRFTFDRRTGTGIEVYRNTARYITISGLEKTPCAALPLLDDLIDALIARHAYGQEAGNSLDFNSAAPQRFLHYDDLIRNGAPEGERSELFQSVVWHLANRGWSSAQITDELGRHANGIGAKYADRLLAEVIRSYEKWRR
jgi:hypothetical protein